MQNPVRELVKAIQTGDRQAAGAALSEAFSEKVRQALEARKVAVAGKLFEKQSQ